MAPVPARIEWPEMSSTDQVHVALFTPGYPYVGAAMRAVELSRRPGAAFSWRVGEPLSPLRDTFARSLLETEATHALMLEGDVVPPPDVVDRLMQADAPVVTAAYPQWVANLSSKLEPNQSPSAAVSTPGGRWAPKEAAMRIAIARSTSWCSR